MIFNDLNFFKIFDEFSQNNQNTTILEIINISKIATADLQQITQKFLSSILKGIDIGISHNRYK